MRLTAHVSVVTSQGIHTHMAYPKRSSEHSGRGPQADCLLVLRWNQKSFLRSVSCHLHFSKSVELPGVHGTQLAYDNTSKCERGGGSYSRSSYDALQVQLLADNMLVTDSTHVHV